MTNEAKARAPVWAIRPKQPRPRRIFPATKVVQYCLMERARNFFWKSALDIGGKLKSLEEQNQPHRGLARVSYETFCGESHIFEFNCYAQSQERFSCCLRLDRDPEFVFSCEVFREPVNESFLSYVGMEITLVEFTNVAYPWALAAAKSKA
jgi:hypothetical protein